MTPAQLTQALDRLQASIRAQEDTIIAQVRAKYVIPYCDRYGLRFTAGMGSWSFDNGKTGYYEIHIGGWSNPHELPKRIWDCLNRSLPSNPGQDLGSVMEDYTPKNYRKARV